MDNLSTWSNHLQHEINKWKPTIFKISRLIAYTNNNKIKRLLTFDRTISPKRKSITLIKTQHQTTKQDILKLFGFREKAQKKPPTLPQQTLDNTNQLNIDMMENFTITNESKGDRLMTLSPNHVRIFYINGLDIRNGDHSLLQLCQILQEKGFDIVCITKPNVHWERAHIYHKLKKISTIHGPRIQLASVHLNSILNGIRITNQEALQCLPWIAFLS